MPSTIFFNYKGIVVGIAGGMYLVFCKRCGTFEDCKCFTLDERTQLLYEIETIMKLREI